MRIFLIAAGLTATLGCAAPNRSLAIAEMPYMRDGKLPMVQVSINGAGPYWFIVDSGASRTVLDSKLAAELGLKEVSKGATTGTGTGAVPLAYVGKVNVSLGAFSYASEPYVIDLSGVPISKQVRGLVGSELFANRVVRIDPVKQKISVFSSAKEAGIKGAAVLPLKSEKGKLYLPARLEPRAGKIMERHLRIDTGSESSVNDPSAADSLITARQVLGGGLGESYEGVSGKFHSVQIGPFQIRDVWGPGGNPPAIGMELLQRFTMTFDAPNGQLYLKSNGQLNRPVPHPPGEVKVAVR